MNTVARFKSATARAASNLAWKSKVEALMSAVWQVNDEGRARGKAAVCGAASSGLKPQYWCSVSALGEVSLRKHRAFTAPVVPEV